MERVEEDLRAGGLSVRSLEWLALTNIPVQLMAAQLDPLSVMNIRVFTCISATIWGHRWH